MDDELRRRDRSRDRAAKTIKTTSTDSRWSTKTVVGVGVSYEFGENLTEVQLSNAKQGAAGCEPMEEDWETALGA